MAGATYTVVIKDFDKDGDITSESIIKAIKSIEDVSAVKFDGKTATASVTMVGKAKLSKSATNEALKSLKLSCDKVEIEKAESQ